MKRTPIYFILGLMSVIIGWEFLFFDNGTNHYNLDRQIAPGHLLIILGVILLIYCIGKIVHYIRHFE